MHALCTRSPSTAAGLDGTLIQPPMRRAVDQGLFGRLLQEYRAAAGLSQAELAELAGLSSRGIGDLERGARRFPYPATVRRLADALQLSGADQVAFVAAAHPSANAGGLRSDVLPLPATSFVGRDSELAAVRRLLDSSRLITLTGPGGSGKTRLALEAVRADPSNTRQERVVLVLLASLARSELVAPTIGQALGIREIAGQPLLHTLVAYLRPRPMLLVLDNFEHLLDAAPLVSNLLSGCPDLRVLATSREALRLSQEREYSVPPLDLPPVGRDAPLPLITQAASVELFLQRAAQVAPALTLTATSGRVVADICLRLDGLPLAIELAAARARVLSPVQLLERLDHRLALLVGGPRDLPARQRTLRDTIAWSHDLLSPGDQRLFRRLAVFNGGCTLAAAEALHSQLTDLDQTVLEGLTSLVDKHLLRREDAPDGEPRFVMLETLREFALERLEASQEYETMRERQAEVFTALAEEAAPYLASGERLPWIGRLAVEQENIRAVLRWAEQRRRPEAGLRIVGALWLWYFLSFREGRAWAERILDLPAPDSANVWRSRALFTASVTAWAAGDGPGVARFGLEGVALARGLGSAERLAYALSVIGSNMPEPRENLHRHYAECLDAANAAGDPWLVAFAQMCYAIGAAQVGDLVTSCEQGRNAVELCRAVGDEWLVAISAGPLGLGLVQLGQPDEAEVYLSEALGTLRQMGDWKWVDNTLLGLALVARHRSDLASMARYYLESLSVCRDVADTGNLPLILEGLAASAVASNDAATAARLLGAAESAHATGGQPIVPAYDDLRARTEAAVQNILDRAAYEAAVSQGRRIDIDQALLEAQTLVATIC